MEKRGVLTKILAVAGTVLILLSILIPVAFSVVSLIEEGVFRFDYLMPLELFPAALTGGGLLVWAALREHSYQKLICWSLGVVVGMLVFGQVIAVVSGLASGEAEPTGFWWAVVLASLIIYSLALIVLGVGGVLLLHSLFKPTKP